MQVWSAYGGSQHSPPGCLILTDWVLSDKRRVYRGHVLVSTHIQMRFVSLSLACSSHSVPLSDSGLFQS